MRIEEAVVKKTLVFYATVNIEPDISLHLAAKRNPSCVQVDPCQIVSPKWKEKGRMRPDP